MRHTCQLKGADGEPCGKPAVDFVTRLDEDEEYNFWLCAQHFDLMQRIRQILDRERG